MYVDGELRNGRDVLTAGALGARACFLGRLPVYALAVDGEAGVARLVDRLALEVRKLLQPAGRARFAEVSADLLAGPGLVTRR